MQLKSPIVRSCLWLSIHMWGYLQFIGQLLEVINPGFKTGDLDQDPVTRSLSRFASAG